MSDKDLIKNFISQYYARYPELYHLFPKIINEKNEDITDRLIVIKQAVGIICSNHTSQTLFNKYWLINNYLNIFLYFQNSLRSSFLYDLSFLQPI